MIVVYPKVSNHKDIYDTEYSIIFDSHVELQYNFDNRFTILNWHYEDDIHWMRPHDRIFDTLGD